MHKRLGLSSQGADLEGKPPYYTPFPTPVGSTRLPIAAAVGTASVLLPAQGLWTPAAQRRRGMGGLRAGVGQLPAVQRGGFDVG